MNKTLKKIALILTAIILLPVIFFSVYEISTLSESEEVIEGIYTNQLDAILFSVNQYSEDYVSSLNSKISTMLIDEENDPEHLKEKLNLFLRENSSIIFLFFANDIDAGDVELHSLNKNLNIDKREVKKFLSSNSELIKRLYTYQRGGYSQIAPVKNSIIPNSASLLFLSGNKNDLKICGLFFNPDEFTRRTLAAKIQGVARDEFIISVFNRDSSNIVYSTEPASLENLQQRKELWLLPGYNLGIQLKGKTIEDLVKERTTTNIILLSLLLLILAIGIYFVFRNIKKEVEFAQIKSDFVSNVSHELRTPLALVSMFAETLEMGRVKTEEKKREYYLIISQETGRLSRIVNKILSFSQIEAGKRKFHFEKTDLNSVTENIIHTYKFHLENNGFKYQFLKEENLPEVNIDKEAVSEAVINLLDNAMKYSKDEKVILIRTGSENNSAFIEVEDKGIGISTDDQKKIFDKFFRVSSGLVHNTKGTGLGLTLVKHIMEAHKGEVKLESSPGKGSTFKLIFYLN